METQEQIVEVQNEAVERTKNVFSQTQDMTMKTYYASIGMLDFLYESALDTVDYSKKIFDKAVERGETIEKNARQEVQDVANEVESRANEAQDRVRKVFRRSEKKADEQLEAGLEQLDLPRKDTVAELNRKLEEINAKVESMIAEQNRVVVEQPMSRYDQLTAKEVVGRLNGLTMDQLAAVKQYEMAHENRVTVLREVDRRLEAMPIAHYDELTVEEIEPLLNTLDAEQLQFVAEYEVAHENRVTLLREIESKLEERKSAVA